MCSSSKRPSSRANAIRLDRLIRVVALVPLVALAWLGSTVHISSDGIAVVDNVASAKGGGGGGNGGGGNGGGGRGGGHGGGHGGYGGHDAASVSGHGKGRGEGHDKGRGLGHSKAEAGGRASAFGHDSASEHGISASTLGSLNAAHASRTAREHAAEESAVHAIADFVNALEPTTMLEDDERIELAAAALASKANKPVTTSVVLQVAHHVNLAVDEDTADAIAERAREMQEGAGSGGS